MGASSVTGVSGPGAASSKGPHNNRDTYVPLLGPRIIVAGIATLNSGGGYTLEFPDPLPGGFYSYSYICTALGVDQFAVSVGGAESDGYLVNLTFMGGVSGINKSISYAVISQGQAAIPVE